MSLLLSRSKRGIAPDELHVLRDAWLTLMPDTHVLVTACSFRDCPQEASMYHQSCIEKFLKRVGCERYASTARTGKPVPAGLAIRAVCCCRNRKTGFDCPRGKGKGTEYSAACNGKVSFRRRYALCRVCSSDSVPLCCLTADSEVSSNPH